MRTKWIASALALATVVWAIGSRGESAEPAAVPAPAQVLRKLQERQDYVNNLKIEATWEEYKNDKPAGWEDGVIYSDRQGRIRARYQHGSGPLASADKQHARLVDDAYNGKFSVHVTEDPQRDRLGSPLQPEQIVSATSHYHYTTVYNFKWPGPRANAESHRNPLHCVDRQVVNDLRQLLKAGRTVTVTAGNGRPGVYQLQYKMDPQHDPHHLKHVVLVDANRGWAVLRHEQFFPDGKSARLAACDYRRGDNGFWVPTSGRLCNLWGKEVPGLDWRFNVRNIVINDPNFDPRVFDVETAPLPLERLTESVSGSVVDPDGKPVAGAVVRCDVHADMVSLIAFCRPPSDEDCGQRTGEDGRFVIEGLPDQPLELTAYIEPPRDAKNQRTFPARRQVQPGDADVRFTLDPKLVRGSTGKK